MARRADHGPSQRQLRVGEEVRHALAWTIERGEVRDEVLARRPVTITEVRMSADLRHATVFFAPLGGNEGDEVQAALEQARPFLRHRVGRAVRLRHVPDLAFRPDPTFEAAGRIERLLREPRVARDLATDGDDGDGA